MMKATYSINPIQLKKTTKLKNKQNNETNEKNEEKAKVKDENRGKKKEKIAKRNNARKTPSPCQKELLAVCGFLFLFFNL